MATKGGEELNGEATPTRILTGMDPAVLAMLICVRGFVSAVALAILLGVHHICQGNARPVDITGLLRIDGIEILTTMLFLGLLSARRLSPAIISFFEILMFSFQGEQPVRAVLVAQFVSKFYFDGDTVKANVATAVIGVGYLTVTFWGALRLRRRLL